MKEMSEKSIPVYSTAQGRLCSGCGQPKLRCLCRKKETPKTDGIVRVGRETKGRKGSGVTLITGIPLADAPLKEMASQLKKRCGSGGTIKNGIIEIQGDHRDFLIEELEKQGYKVKRVGG